MSVCSVCLQLNDEFLGFEEVDDDLCVAPLLRRYFPFCFEEDAVDGKICQKCWCQVKTFHLFYVRIESVHSSIHRVEEIFVDTIKTEPFEPQLTSERLSDEEIDGDQAMVDTVYSDTGNSDSDSLPDIFDEFFNEKKKSKGKTKQKKKTQQKQKDIRNKDKDENKKTRSQKPVLISGSPIQCGLCSESFLSTQKMHLHIRMVHEGLTHECRHPKCSAFFATAEEADKHYNESHPPQDECQYCHKMYSRNNLDLHVQKEHQSQQSAICDICGLVLSSKGALNAHTESFHIIQPRAHCDICGKTFKNKAGIRYHIRAIHVLGPRTCEKCGKTYPHARSLRNHLRIHNEATREQYKCDICGRGFRDRRKLKEHSYIHSGITDAYLCNHCGKPFRFFSSLSAHRKKAHPAEEAIRIQNAEQAARS